MEKIRLYDKEFIMSVTPRQIQETVSAIAEKINHDMSGEEPLFIGILNGSFMFMSDLLKKVRMNCQVSFVKLSSYKGSGSTGKVTELIGLDTDIKGKSVIIVEDIVDTGTTLESITESLNPCKAKQIKTATLLLKPMAITADVHPDYIGISIPNDFVIGYGLDYNGLGRNYEGIYKLI